MQCTAQQHAAVWCDSVFVNSIEQKAIWCRIINSLPCCWNCKLENCDESQRRSIKLGSIIKWNEGRIMRFYYLVSTCDNAIEMRAGRRNVIFSSFLLFNWIELNWNTCWHRLVSGEIAVNGFVRRVVVVVGLRLGVFDRVQTAWWVAHWFHS